MTDTHDTPTQRATINQLSVDELDTMLEGIRSRRLQRVLKLEAIAKVKSDEAQLIHWMKFERAYGIAKRHLAKCEEMEKKAEELVHKARLRMMAVQMEVGMDDAAD